MENSKMSRLVPNKNADKNRHKGYVVATIIPRHTVLLACSCKATFRLTNADQKKKTYSV